MLSKRFRNRAVQASRAQQNKPWAAHPFKENTFNYAFRSWLRSLPPDIGQFIAGQLAGYEPKEIAAARNWSRAHLIEVQMATDTAVQLRIAERDAP